MSSKQRGLGKGLDVIFAENDADDGSSSMEVNINELEPNRNQPRREFNEAELAELADSIAKHGILQPLLVRPLRDEGGYQIVAGERRWRAARMAGLQEVPVLVRELTDQQVMELALIENLQRSDLNPLEEAQGYQALMDQYSMTQEEVADSVGKSRPSIANALRLMHLPEGVQKFLSEGKLTSGQARTILSFPPEYQSGIAKRCVQEGLTVRQLEKLAKHFTVNSSKSNLKKEIPFYEEAALSLHDQLGRHVRVTGSRKKGVLHIAFNGEEDLKALLKLFE
ncbi:MAG: ParB/RepB/Spo0J family partition protein [Oscillospiraceae bacterium]|jgi:ParB family chromosome partitioning protein|nr:ParB/RepB/Spo0J family partition protein [Oscillospiraceae bacterium]HCA72294.1 stage 0 sporulation protein J [Oscillospiraceae bacterium]